MDQKGIEDPQQLKIIIENLESELDELTSQRDELKQPSGGKMLKMFGIDKDEAVKRLDEQIADKQAQIEKLREILEEAEE